MFLTKEELTMRSLHKLCTLLASTALMIAMVTIFAAMFLTWGM